MRQRAGRLGQVGKNANCQTLLSLILARGELLVTVGLRLFLPVGWTDDPDRMARAGVPEDLRRPRTKAEIAPAEIDRVRAEGRAIAYGSQAWTFAPAWPGTALQIFPESGRPAAQSGKIFLSKTTLAGSLASICDGPGAEGGRFGCVLADAGCGSSAPFRQALSARGLIWAVGISRRNKVYPLDVAMIFPVAGRGRPRQRHVPDRPSVAAETVLAESPTSSRSAAIPFPDACSSGWPPCSPWPSA